VARQNDCKLDLDDDIFPNTRSGRDDAGNVSAAATTRAGVPEDRREKVERISLEVVRRRNQRPRLTTARDAELKQQLNAQRELAQRYAQIADLCNIRQQQDVELQIARSGIADLEKSNAVLRLALENQSADATAAQQAFNKFSAENKTLRARVSKLEKENEATLKHSLTIATSINNRSVLLASAQEQVGLLQKQLSEKTAEVNRLTATLEERKKRSQCNLDWYDACSPVEAARPESVVAYRDKELRKLSELNSELLTRCGQLTAKVDELKSQSRAADARIESQRRFIEVLQRALRLERDAQSGELDGGSCSQQRLVTTNKIGRPLGLGNDTKSRGNFVRCFGWPRPINFDWCSAHRDAVAHIALWLEVRSKIPCHWRQQTGAC
jgi:hypothetical protein